MSGHEEAHQPGAHDRHPQQGSDHHDLSHDGRHGHRHTRSPWAYVREILRPHTHDHVDSLDSTLMVSQAGTRALVISFAGLLVTAIIQVVVFSVSRSVGLLADTIHNFADALTALPIGLAFLVARRPPTRRYTYGYGRAEDLAGVVVVALMAVSVAFAAWAASERLLHPRHVGNLGWVAAAGTVGFIGNEVAAL